MDSPTPTPDHVAALVRLAELLRGQPRLLLTREEAAECLGISLRSFERYVQPRIKLVQIGSKLLVPIKELEAWVARRTEV
jgi:excisionase family DNA binding protein